MNKIENDITIYRSTVLRVVPRNAVEPAVVKLLPSTGNGQHIDDSDETAGINRKDLPEFYQHHLRPKKFEFY